jgi:hypothetical protein
MEAVTAIRIPDHGRWASVRDEVARGRLWKARDRLRGHLRDDPANQDVLDMLGAVHFAMGDLPEAGRHWWLTDRDDESARSARVAFEERFGTDAEAVLRALPRPARPDRYPPPVRARLEEVVAAAGIPLATWRWARPAAERLPDVRRPPSLRSRIGVAGPPIAFVALIALLLIGLATIVGWVLELVS